MTTGNNTNRVRFGPYEADLQTQELWKSGIRLKLGGQPFGILTLLLGRPGELVSREELRSSLWSSETFVDFNHGLNAAMNKLRDCLNDSAEDPKYIETLPRRGYRFIASVETTARAAVEPPPPLPPPAPAPQQSLSPPEMFPPIEAAARLGKRNPRRPTFRWAAIFLVLVAVAAAGMFVHRRRQPFATPEGTTVLDNASRPVVAPVFSPDGQLIALRVERDSGHPPGIYVSDPQSGDLLQKTSDASDGSPTWSPDGQNLAFVRTGPHGRAIYILPLKDGAEHLLTALGSESSQNDLDWSPDGRSIAFAGISSDGSSPLFAISVASQDRQALTAPTGKDQDWGPAYAPDGKRLAFVRRREADHTENVFLVALDHGTVQQLTSGSGHIQGPPAWTSDGRSILYASTQSGEARLWRVPSSGGSPEIVTGVSAPSWHPTIPRAGRSLLAYESALGESSIWRINVSSPEPNGGSVVVSALGSNEGPQLSPNGRKLAFMSNRGGSMEIWISDPDGSYPLKLTNLDGCGSPRWSPDSRSIVFDSIHTGSPAVYVVGLDGGEPRLVAGNDSETYVPSWSHDGKWIYFASNRDGGDFVWKTAAVGGGPAVRVTQHPGFFAQESADGKTLYFASSRFPLPEIWQMPVGGGGETLVSPLLRPESWAGWIATEKGFYFLAPGGEGRGTIAYFDAQEGTTRLITRLSGNAFWLSASSDGKTIWYNQRQEAQSVILVKRDFH
jgi:Tol biopolymer transport system component/DNA-binding winged helix-turn-helix (wHTH) protein